MFHELVHRLSRARRVIENTFGILVARWRLLAKTMNMDPENCITSIKACLVLHNYVKSKANLQRSGFMHALNLQPH